LINLRWLSPGESLLDFRLPIYAPDLNPVGGLRSVLKRGVLANLTVAGFACLVRVIRQGLKNIQYQPGLIEGSSPRRS
jgi:hypothetical protein